MDVYEQAVGRARVYRGGRVNAHEEGFVGTAGFIRYGEYEERRGVYNRRIHREPCDTGPGVPAGPEAHLKIYYPPICVRLMYRRPHACPPPAPACIVLPRAAPRCAAARTPRTGYCGRRRRSDRPFRTGLQRWLEEGCEVFHKPPSFMSSLNPFFQT